MAYKNLPALKVDLTVRFREIDRLVDSAVEDMVDKIEELGYKVDVGIVEPDEDADEQA